MPKQKIEQEQDDEAFDEDYSDDEYTFSTNDLKPEIKEAFSLLEVYF